MLEPNPVWKDGPLICAKTGLPAFDNQAEAMAFHQRNSPGSAIYRMGECKACGQIHYLAKMRPPSGASSGTGRNERKKL